MAGATTRPGSASRCPPKREDSTFPSRVKITAYPVQELGGLIFAYMGPQPAPLLPRWDLFVMDNVMRDVGFQVLPCNWLQMQENDLDPAHLQNLHGNFSNYALERLGPAGPRAPPRPTGRRTGIAEPEKWADVEWRDWEIYEQGVMNTEKERDLRQVRPSLFPNMNSFATRVHVPRADGRHAHAARLLHGLSEAAG